MDMNIIGGNETGGLIPARFLVGDRVDVLVACHLPQREVVKGSGVIERITFQSSDGEPLYWVSGFACARTVATLRLICRGER